ncbi:MAG: hypothetical protein CJBNEKGG_04436 [Prosthecobacter sp.]|nr:hypothetical protein [Prosthecobacter sp.]
MYSIFKTYLTRPIATIATALFLYFLLAVFLASLVAEPDDKVLSSEEALWGDVLTVVVILISLTFAPLLTGIAKK